MRAAWELAQFTDGESHLGKPIPTGELLVPKGAIRLDAKNEALLWVPRESHWEWVRPQPAMFNTFVRLWQEPPIAIARYAQQWGILHLDAQGIPCVRDYTPRYSPDGQELPQVEPLAAWLKFSRRAHAVLTIAANLKQGKRASPTDWETVLGDSMKSIGYWSLEIERRLLAGELRGWLKIGRPAFGFNERSWKLEIDYAGFLLSAIALQLALTITSAQGLFTCSHCGNPYPRQKKAPKQGQGNYCDACGPREALREANTRLRAKITEARRLRDEGVGIREIAKKLNVRKTKRSTALQTVARWIGKES